MHSLPEHRDDKCSLFQEGVKNLFESGNPLCLNKFVDLVEMKLTVQYQNISQ